METIVRNPGRGKIVEGLVRVIHREGALPAAALHDRLWAIGLRMSRHEVFGALSYAEGQCLIASVPHAFNGNRVRAYYYLLDAGSG